MPGNLDTLACLTAKSGDLEKAIQIEYEALKILEIENSPDSVTNEGLFEDVILPRMLKQKKEYNERIKEWQKRLEDEKVQEHY
ncbi:hypothetical protein ACFL27_02360 [candidate division CSSED10-310 bacterium]|uniref:Tetratricopeptide repeat protein n=1 Tax=candidate division CSSED10-310 bacterium TaxID=2855610 RepID=A0ABV6YS74_UNCC1